MLKVLFHILFSFMGFTLTLGIMGVVLCSLQKHSSKLLQIIGEFHIRNNLHSGSHSYNSYN